MYLVSAYLYRFVYVLSLQEITQLGEVVYLSQVKLITHTGEKLDRVFVLFQNVLVMLSLGPRLSGYHYEVSKMYCQHVLIELYFHTAWSHHCHYYQYHYHNYFKKKRFLSGGCLLETFSSHGALLYQCVLFLALLMHLAVLMKFKLTKVEWSQFG